MAPPWIPRKPGRPLGPGETRKPDRLAAGTRPIRVHSLQQPCPVWYFLTAWRPPGGRRRRFARSGRRAPRTVILAPGAGDNSYITSVD